MKQKFKIEIELPNDWKLTPQFLKDLIEKETILKVNSIKEYKSNPQPPVNHEQERFET